MDKAEWFELVEQNNKATIALESCDIQQIVDDVNGLIRLVNMKAGEEAEYGGWYSELEQFIDSLPLE